jgi:hypothetical protein
VTASAASRASTRSKRASLRRRKQPCKPVRKARSASRSWAGMRPSVPEPPADGQRAPVLLRLGLNHKLRWGSVSELPSGSCSVLVDQDDGPVDKLLGSIDNSGWQELKTHRRWASI